MFSNMATKKTILSKFSIIQKGMLNVYEKARQMKKVFCFNNCACRVFRTNLVLVWFQCCPRYFSRKKGISGTFLSLGLRPRLQKPCPWFPFFYLGFKNLLLAILFSTSITWEKPNYTWNIFPESSQNNYSNKILFHLRDLVKNFSLLVPLYKV